MSINIFLSISLIMILSELLTIFKVICHIGRHTWEKDKCEFVILKMLNIFRYNFLKYSRYNADNRNMNINFIVWIISLCENWI